jgi:hypothetical protein
MNPRRLKIVAILLSLAAVAALVVVAAVVAGALYWFNARAATEPAAAGYAAYENGD